MITLSRKSEKRPLGTTISLINIVFLMLIFFLVAGQLAPPLDGQVDLSKSEEAPPLPPPDALYARADGTLVYRDEEISAEAFLGLQAPTGDEIVRLGADAALPADKLLNHVAALYAAGARKVLIVTRKADP
jgi:biopolymer transport protein ExbD